MKIGIATLGCKVNQYETQAMEQELTRRGHTLVPFEEKADAYIINTCSVTAVSDHKSRQMIRRARKNNENAVVAALGCYTQTHEIDKEELGVDLLYGTAHRMELLDALEEALKEKKSKEVKEDILRYHTFEPMPPGGLTNRTRAMLKIEDGCQNFCTYCIIPFARGPVRSCPLDTVVEDAKRLAQEGYLEIVLTGIEISSYGQDLEGNVGLIDLLEALSQAVPGVRLRIGSLEPRTITQDFCARARACENLCHHFHLSMQSGCDATLKRMNRRYTTERFLESCHLLKETFPDCAITTDMITGFPEETEEEFQESLAFIEKCGFMDMHIFPYSLREGTKAAELVQIEKKIKEDRAAQATAIAGKMHQNYLKAMIGTEVEVLFEQEKDGLYLGHTKNYVEVGVRGKDLHNTIQKVIIKDIQGEYLVGELT